MVEHEADLLCELLPRLGRAREALPALVFEGLPLAHENRLCLLLRNGLGRLCPPELFNGLLEVHLKSPKLISVHGVHDAESPGVARELTLVLHRCLQLPLRLFFAHVRELGLPSLEGTLQLSLAPGACPVKQRLQGGSELGVDLFTGLPFTQTLGARCQKGLALLRQTLWTLNKLSRDLLHDVFKLALQLNLLDRLVVQQVRAIAVEHTPNRHSVEAPVRQSGEFRSILPCGRWAAGLKENLLAQPQSLLGEEICGPPHLPARVRLEVTSEGRGEQKDALGIERDQFVKAQGEVIRGLREVLPHQAQGIRMHGMGAIMLVPENEEHLRLKLRHSEVLHGKEAHLQEVLKLPGELALVVDEHHVRAGHGH
mmetsp:Transcript_68297/g.148665  ORF Transcript_68297/g.148665 Transcript_68297/m.148665 type:complete len:369 (+) Transcript_68297:1831-2937(+)